MPIMTVPTLKRSRQREFQLKKIKSCLSGIWVGFLLSGCGGGGGAGATPPPVQLDPFSIVSVSPAEGATGVSRTTGFSAKFNRAVDPASANGNNAQLLGPEGNSIPGNVVVSGADLQFNTVAAGLPGGSTYKVSLSTQLKGSAGGSLGTTYTRSFTTAAQAWDSHYAVVAPLAAFTGGTSPMAVADQTGNVTAIWSLGNGSATSIFTSRLDARTGIWGATNTAFTTADFGSLGALQTAVAGNGDVFASWITNVSNGLPGIQVMRYSAATGVWGMPEQVTTLPVGVSQMGFAFTADSAGNVTILSVAITGLSAQTGSWEYGIFATRFDVASAKWSTPKKMETLGTETIDTLKLVVDGGGNVTAAWVMNSSSARVLQAAHYTATTGSWSAAKVVDPKIQTGVPSNFSIGVDTAGRVISLCPHQNSPGGVVQINASRFDPTSGEWTAPTQLDGGTGINGGFGSPLVMVNSAGFATAVWSQSDGLYSSHFSPATGVWSNQVHFATGALNSVPALTIDVAGNASATYVENRLDGFKVMATSFSATNRVWDAPAIIDLPPAGTTLFANPPIAVVSPSGTVTALWFAQTSKAGSAQYGLVAQQFK